MTGTKLIIVAAFKRNKDGDLVPAFDAVAFGSEERALRSALSLADQHTGVMAWTHNTGERVVLFQSGDVPASEWDELLGGT